MSVRKKGVLSLLVVGVIGIIYWSFANHDIDESDHVGAMSSKSKHTVPVVVFDTAGTRLLYSDDSSEGQYSRSYRKLGSEESIDIPINLKDETSFHVALHEKAKPDSSIFMNVDSIMVLSDIEGSFSSFVGFLRGSGIMSSDFNWTFGSNHLVLLGDFMDRGNEVFQCLWLIYKLDHQAEQSGGHVHFVLGNHELLNIRLWVDDSDMTYVHPSYIDRAHRLNLPYKYWISPWSVLGQWMRTKNCALTINNQLFVHGGLSPELAEWKMDIPEINKVNRTLMEKPIRDFSKKERIIYGKYGPYWYRGLADQILSEHQVDELLQTYQLRKIILGHTIVHKDIISPIYQNRIIPVDLNHHNNYTKGVIRGLLIAHDTLYEIDNIKNVRKL